MVAISPGCYLILLFLTLVSLMWLHGTVVRIKLQSQLHTLPQVIPLPTSLADRNKPSSGHP